MADLKLLETLVPSQNGVTVFDAETQETSYGICVLDGLPYIFDTHRKDRFYVATIELLTELVIPVRIPTKRVRAFCRDARARGASDPVLRLFLQGESPRLLVLGSRSRIRPRDGRDHRGAIRTEPLRALEWLVA